MNLPNKLTVLRLILVPIIIIALLLPINVWTNIISALIFGIASFTDMLDGKIARKRGLITDFGKFLDPLADKFMVIAAFIGIICRAYIYGQDSVLMFAIFMPALVVTIFRELAVASIRLVASTTGGVVVPANMLGKIKTVSQIVCVLFALIEPLLNSIFTKINENLNLFSYFPITILSATIMTVFTIISGIVYVKTYWKFLDPQK